MTNQVSAFAPAKARAFAEQTPTLIYRVAQCSIRNAAAIAHADFRTNANVVTLAEAW